MEGLQMEVGLLNWAQKNTVYTAITDGKNNFHYLELKFFPRLVFQCDIFIINIFGEVHIGI